MHEINNPLATIAACAESRCELSHEDGAAPRSLDGLRAHPERSAALQAASWTRCSTSAGPRPATKSLVERQRRDRAHAVRAQAPHRGSRSSASSWSSTARSAHVVRANARAARAGVHGAADQRDGRHARSSGTVTLRTRVGRRRRVASSPRSSTRARASAAPTCRRSSSPSSPRSRRAAARGSACPSATRIVAEHGGRIEVDSAPRRRAACSASSCRARRRTTRDART